MRAAKSKNLSLESVAMLDTLPQSNERGANSVLLLFGLKKRTRAAWVGRIWFD